MKMCSMLFENVFEDNKYFLFQKFSSMNDISPFSGIWSCVPQEETSLLI